MALDLRVRGKTELTLSARPAGTYLQVRGRLHDELGAPLSTRSVEVTVDPVSSAAVDPTTESALTDREGRFTASFPGLEPGQYAVRARFSATSHLEGASKRVETTVRREPIELSTRAPQLVVGKASRVPVRVRATAGGTPRPAEVAISVGGERRARLQLGGHGRGRLDVSEWLEPGDNPVVVRVTDETPGAEGAEPSRTSIGLARRLEVSGSARVVWDRLRRGVEVRGRLEGTEGPVASAPVELQLVRSRSRGPDVGSNASGVARSRTRRTRTEGDGVFRAFFELGSLSDGRWRARARVMPPVGPASTHEVGSVRLDRSVQRYGADLAAVVGLGGLVLFLGWGAWRLARRRWRDRRGSPADEPDLERAFDEEAEIAVARTGSVDEAPGDSVAGVVWDPLRGEPVEGARVECRRSDGEDRQRDAQTTGEDGRFAFEELAEGTWELTADAPTYAPGRLRVELPHDGGLADARFELVPVPLKIRRMYESLARAAEGGVRWGEVSPRDIEALLHRAAGTEAVDGDRATTFARRIRQLIDGRNEPASTREYVEALRDIVEETWFSDRRHGRETWRLARRIAEQLRAEIADEAGEG
ncbi:MAG: carboxypeptidase-like regulatory domain-containing protein [Bradymonadaceae bacterium]